MFTKLVNDLAFAQADQLAAPVPLATATAAFNSASGSVEERLAFAIRAACLSGLRPENEMVLPPYLDELDKIELRNLADSYGVHLSLSTTVWQMRATLRAEKDRRRNVNDSIARRDQLTE